MNEKKVLVIDDEDFIRELVKDFLEMDGVQCEGVDCAEDALEWINKESFNLILLDRNLGKMKAEDVIAQIKEVNTEVPVIILTGDPQCDAEYLEKIGANGIIFKPFQVSEFMDNISKFLEI